MEKLCYAINNQKKSVVGILITDRKDFKTKNISRDEEKHFKIKVSIHQEDIKVINI